MLLQFCVSNFRSIKDKITFSMIAEKATTRKNGLCFETDYKKLKYVSSQSVIFGANASGKSNLLHALKFMYETVTNSAKSMSEGDRFEFHNFKFDDQSNNESPSEFEIYFVHEGYMFQYGFKLNKYMILEEWLYGTDLNKNSNKRQVSKLWLERDQNNIQFGDDMEVSDLTKTSWIEQTRENVLLLSSIVKLGSKQAKLPYSWFLGKLRVLPDSRDLTRGYTISKLEDPEFKSDFLKIMQALDFSFSDISVTEEKVEESALPSWILDDIKKTIPDKFEEGKLLLTKVETLYQVNNQKYTLDYDDESTGTKQLISFLGLIIDVLKNSRVLIVDELQLSLHPRALDSIVKIFSNERINKNSAQLIFTTHDTSITKNFCQEQIWLVEKDNHTLSSNLYSINEFELRKGINIEKYYLEGRFGAVPVIDDLEEVFGG